tara:strand:+ start:173 stop:562 length:390 start_codon:yes stop_codon:yes gene_type:complete
LGDFLVTTIRNIKIIVGNFERYVDRLVKNQLAIEKLKVEALISPEYVMTEDQMELAGKKVRDWAIDVIAKRVEKEVAETIEFQLHEWLDSDLFKRKPKITGSLVKETSNATTHWIEKLEVIEDRLVQVI